MRNAFAAAALLTLLVPGVACAQFMPERARLFMSARYAELEQLGEKELAADPKGSTYKLAYLCIGYGKLKRYGKLFPCLDRLEQNVARGDVGMQNFEEMSRGNPFMAGFAAIGSVFIGGTKRLESDVTPWISLARAEAFAELRDYDRAIEAAKKLFAAIPDNNERQSWRIQSHAILGLTHALAGKREEAAKYAEALADLSASFPYTALAPDKVIGLTRIWLALGEYQKAYDALRSERAGLGTAILAFGDALGGALSGMAGESMFTYVDLPKQFMGIKTEMETGRVKEAKEGYDKLLANKRVSGNGEIYWVVLHDRGRIAAQEGDLKTAIDLWTRAVEVIEQQRSTINTEASKIGFVGDKQAVYRRLIEALFASQQLAQAFDYLERSKARALVDMLASKKDFAVHGADPDKVRALLASAESAEISARAQDGHALPAAQGSQQRTLTVAPTRQEMVQAAPELASLVSVTSTPIAEIQALLPEDEALIEYYYDDASLYAFVLTRGGLQGAKLDAKGLDADARAIRDALDEPQSQRYLGPAQRLHASLIAPLRGMLGARSKLLIVAHGALHYVPFAALHDGERFLLERFSLRFLPSASVIKYLPAQRAPRPAGILAFGNPDLGDARLDLRYAEEEARSIVKRVPQSRALLRGEATESAVRNYAAGFNYLHFATHGRFDPESPLNSALMLARDASSDGLLTVGKLYSMQLGVDLVTLSACETGLGKVANGDDVVGLTRGFLYAGATTIVASLWKVDDQATADLMTRFYEGLSPENPALAAADKREALRAAQLALRERYPHPYFWAGFQLTGRAN
jgi:CHAT domain-containing protein